mgnify:CR=1 FL=1
MPIIETCGHESKRTEFSYSGSVEQGVVIEFDSGNFEIDANIIRSVIENFSGQEVLGGFSMSDAPPGGVGAFLTQQATKLTPRHASFLCAILNHENHAKCSLSGNAVIIKFNG